METLSSMQYTPQGILMSCVLASWKVVVVVVVGCSDGICSLPVYKSQFHC